MEVEIKKGDVAPSPPPPPPWHPGIHLSHPSPTPPICISGNHFVNQQQTSVINPNAKRNHT